MTRHRVLDNLYVWPLYWYYALRPVRDYRRHCIRDWLRGLG
jgi:hypothetical protein